MIAPPYLGAPKFANAMSNPPGYLVFASGGKVTCVGSNQQNEIRLFHTYSQDKNISLLKYDATTFKPPSSITKVAWVVEMAANMKKIKAEMRVKPMEPIFP